MKILFTSDKTTAPSTVFNAEAFRTVGDIPGVQIDFFNKNYSEYDTVFFMGYDPDIQSAKKENPSILVGVIDPRPTSPVELTGCDFIIANGIEMKDWYQRVTPNIYNYYIYPILDKAKVAERNNDNIIIGYHGNQLHLKAMFPRITDAINNISQQYQIEFRAMYNIEANGEFRHRELSSVNFDFKHIQWSFENYYKYLAAADIGVVPGLQPINRDRAVKFVASSYKKRFNEDRTDYMLRFKATSNPGRIFVFAQLGVPVIADMLPSSLQVIQDDYNGKVCYSTAAWQNALSGLCKSKALRDELASNMLTEFEQKYSIERLNIGLLDFLNRL